MKVKSDARALVMNELGMREEQLQEDLTTLRSWLAAQPHLPKEFIFTDDMLITFLIASKNSLEMCKRKLDGYLSARRHLPELFQARDPCQDSIREHNETNYFVIMPDLTPDLCRLIILTTVNPDSDTFDFVRCSKRVMNIMDVRLTSSDYHLGDYVVLDATNFGPGHVLKLRLDQVRTMLIIAQEELPTRLKALIFINSPTLIEQTVNKLVKPFLKKKLAERIFVYSEGGTALHKHFPKEILPKDYGGDAPCLKELNMEWVKKCEAKSEWCTTQGILTTDESKRPKPEPGSTDHFSGLAGTFRRLEID